MAAFPSYPPRYSEEDLEALVDQIRDWQFDHGSLLKAPPSTGRVLARPIGVALFPSLLPSQCFQEAVELQTAYNQLYAMVSSHGEWLGETLHRHGVIFRLLGNWLRYTV